TAGRTGPEPAAAELLDDLAPGHAVSGLRGLFRALCRRVRVAYRAPERPRLDSPDPPLDHDGVAGLEPGHGAGFPLGLRGAGLGRLLGVGPGGKRVPHAVADGHRLHSLGDGAGAPGQAEGLEGGPGRADGMSLRI